jgi:ATP-dependent Zn protease
MIHHVTLLFFFFTDLILRLYRFDREISVEAPDVTTRKKLITSQLKTMPIDPSVNIGNVV